MDNNFRQRLQSAMTYQEYVQYYNKEPDSPRIIPKQSPVDVVSDLELSPLMEQNKKQLNVQSCKVIRVKEIL